MEEPHNIQAADPTHEAAPYDSVMSADELTTVSETLTALSQKLPDHNDHEPLDENMQIGAQDSGYNSSGSSVQQSPGEILSGDPERTLIRPRSRASSHTSFSSIPASVLTNLPDGMRQMNAHDVQEYMFQHWENHAPAKPEGQVQSPHTIRQREATFRKPSSVRAMQMHTEDEGDDEYLTPPRRRGGQRISDISVRSAGSSPLKRSPFYSPTGAVSKPKVKKEYPLVLLHCTLLPPSLPVPGLVAHRDHHKILREVLPSVYWKRWRLLEEKIGSGVLRDRGVLISHPEDMYDLLEERLLESLELQRPRLDHGHFLGRDETESDREDRLAREDSGTEDEGEKCLDCGGRVVAHNTGRKWEIKVFAANGLMRAGAWAAAWKEMEKVDVEVGLWLPSDVRAELEKRLIEDASSHPDTSLSVPLLQVPEDILVSPSVPPRTPNVVQDERVPRVTQGHGRATSPSLSMVKPPDGQTLDLHPRKSSDDIDLQTLLINYIRVLASDRRNVAIAFLSVLLLFSAINSRFATNTPTPDLRPFPRDILDHTVSSLVPPQQRPPQTGVEGVSYEILSATASDPMTAVASTVISESTPSSEAILSLAANILSATSSDPITVLASAASTESSTASTLEAEPSVLEHEEPLPTAIEAPLVANTHVVPEASTSPDDIISFVADPSVGEPEKQSPAEIEKAWADSTQIGVSEAFSSSEDTSKFMVEESVVEPAVIQPEAIQIEETGTETPLDRSTHVASENLEEPAQTGGVPQLVAEPASSAVPVAVEIEEIEEVAEVQEVEGDKVSPIDNNEPNEQVRLA